jgi:hypothetical protein
MLVVPDEGNQSCWSRYARKGVARSFDDKAMTKMGCNVHVPVISETYTLALKGRF